MEISLRFLQTSLQEQLTQNKQLKEENRDLKEKIDGVYGAYLSLQYVQERAPNAHDLLAKDARIRLLENFLDCHVQGWKFKINRFKEVCHENAEMREM